MAEFREWPSTARIFRDITITEKLDGTNACVIFERAPYPNLSPDACNLRTIRDGDQAYYTYAQSRNRLITPSKDNAGFAKWVEQNAERLFYVLGEGRHYGEWWGQGIGRKYDMDRKVFSIFNTAGWYKEEVNGLTITTSRAFRAFGSGLNINVVPVLFQGMFSEETIRDYAHWLKTHGSYATHEYTGDNFKNPEGICIYHKSADIVLKYTLDNNDKHKWDGVLVDIPKRTLMDKILRRK